MEWILIILIGGWNGRGANVHTERFRTEEACKVVGEAARSISSTNMPLAWTCKEVERYR